MAGFQMSTEARLSERERFLRSSTRGGISRFSGPLEAQPISVGIAKIELLHPVWRDFRRLKLKTLRAQLLIDSIHIGGAEINARILVRCGSCGIGRHWTFVIEFVGGIQHHFGAAEPEEAPVKLIFTAEVGRRGNDSKPQRVTIKPYGRGHVVDL
jgi:hypothetical protein